MNKVILIGYIGQEPKLKTVGDKQIATFSLSTRRGKEL